MNIKTSIILGYQVSCGCLHKYSVIQEAPYVCEQSCGRPHLVQWFRNSHIIYGEEGSQEGNVRVQLIQASMCVVFIFCLRSC